jgi:hypothetical protein
MPDPGPAPDNTAKTSTARTTRVEVSFQVLQYPDGQPFLALVFSRDGEPLSGEDKLFTFDLAPGTTQDEAATIAEVLNRRVTHLALTSQAGD